MVCQRCIQVVESELRKMGIIPIKVDLGEVTIITSKNPADTALIEEKLRPLGFQLLEDKKIKTVNQVKELIEEVYSGNYDFPVKFRFSDLIIHQLHKDYDSTSALFALLEHKTLERFIIDFRILKIKEFLVYSSFTLSDIAFKLNFSSVAHLSRQFKQFTGQTPSRFKEVNNAKLQIEFCDN